jgi:probable phosphoglycerate mutase
MQLGNDPNPLNGEEQTYPSTRLLLVRHAHHDLTTDDGPLTEVGLGQVDALSRALRHSGHDVCVSSPLRRATATASAISEAVRIVQDLEEFRFGPSAPSIQEVTEQRIDLTLWRPDDGLPGGETLGQFQARVASLLQLLVASHLGHSVLAVTHAGVIDAALRWAYGLAPIAEWSTEALVANASITELEHWPYGRQRGGAVEFTLLRRVGDVSHLASELVTGA